MTIELKKISADNVPAEALEMLRPHAQKSGFGNTEASAVRFAIVELARRLREEAKYATAEAAKNGG